MRQRESTLGRGLWLALLALLGAYVVADFARSPLLGQGGSAAVRAPRVTLWVPGPEAGGEAAIVAHGVAAGLELGRRPAAVRSLGGGASLSMAGLLAREPRRRGSDLLVLSSATLAGLARDRRDSLVPGAAEGAALARELLSRARPVALLSVDRLALGVAPDSPIDGGAELLRELRAAPWRRLFAIPDDGFSRAQLAALVDRAGVHGEARFSVFDSGAVAADAVQSGRAGVVLALRSGLREEVRAGRLRALRWPLDGGRAPRSWVAVVAPPGLGATRLARLRSWLAEVTAEPRWRRAMRRQGRAPATARGPALKRMLRRGAVAADRLQRLAQQVEGR